MRDSLRQAVMSLLTVLVLGGVRNGLATYRSKKQLHLEKR
jgi:hypothetical protein